MPNLAQTVIFMAVEEDSLKTLGDLLTLPDIDVNARNKDGETALMMAARLGSARIAQELLNRSRFGLANADIICIFIILMRTFSKRSQKITRMRGEERGVDCLWLRL